MQSREYIYKMTKNQNSFRKSASWLLLKFISLRSFDE